MNIFPLKQNLHTSNLHNPYILLNLIPSLYLLKTLKILALKNCCTFNSFYLNPITFQHHHFLPKTNQHFSNYEKYIYILKVVIQNTQPNTHPSLNLIPSRYLLKKTLKNSGIKNTNVH